MVLEMCFTKSASQSISMEGMEETRRRFDSRSVLKFVSNQLEVGPSLGMK